MSRQTDGHTYTRQSHPNPESHKPKHAPATALRVACVRCFLEKRPRHTTKFQPARPTNKVIVRKSIIWQQQQYMPVRQAILTQASNGCNNGNHRNTTRPNHTPMTRRKTNHTRVKSNPNIVGHRQIHEQALVVDKSAPRHFLQAVCGAVGQVGEGSKNALLHHVEGTVVRLLPTQQIPRLERPQFGELPNFHGLVSDGGLVNDRLEHLH